MPACSRDESSESNFISKTRLPHYFGATRHEKARARSLGDRRITGLILALAIGATRRHEKARARSLGDRRIMPAKPANRSPRRSWRLGPLIDDRDLYEGATETAERPRPQQVTFVGAIIFLAVVLTIFTYHSSHYEGSEGHSIARAHSNAMTKVEEGDTVSLIHPQCARGKSDLKDRPMIIFKSARTGSTWLGWTFNELKLRSGKDILLTTEVGSCGKIFNRQLVKWFIKYFNQGRKGLKDDNEEPSKDRHGRRLKLKCRVDEDGNNNYGPIVATVDVKSNPEDIPEEEAVPDLTLEQWGEVFEAVPDLAIGVLVRTNAVKRAISSIAVEEQVRICGDKVGKKLTGKEKCIKKLPDQIHLNTTELWSHVEKSDRKRTKLPELAARLSSKYSDGGIFCVSYEEMELDMPKVMEDMGQFVGADVDPKSISALREKQVSKKRGSDDLSEYISNYEEVRQSLSSNKCVLEQLESKKPKVFPACLK